jgi:hypothetical protein
MRQLSAAKAVKPIPGISPNNSRLPCNAGFYLLDERSDTKSFTLSCRSKWIATLLVSARVCPNTPPAGARLL